MTFKPRKHQIEIVDILNDISDHYKKTGILKKSKIIEEIFPGGGKSIHPLIAGRILKDAGIIDKIAWITPRKSLKKQGAEECMKVESQEIYPHNLVLREVETANDYDPTRGTDGFITTYQALVTAKGNNKLNNNYNYEEFKKHRYLIFLDEIHHVFSNPTCKNGSKEEKEGFNYFQALKPMCDNAAFIIGASGTLTRNDKRQEIAFVDYEVKTLNGQKVKEIHRDVVYDYEDSLKDKANIPILYNTGDTEEIKYTKNGKKFRKYKIENSDDRRVALTTEYGEALLEKGLKSWEDHRMRRNPRSKLIIIGNSQKDCQRYKVILKRFGYSCALAISDEKKEAHEAIDRFRRDPREKILVTCQMAYEGLDCKQATHVIVLTNIRSFPWLLQMLTRVLRADTHANAIPYERQYGICFCPDDDDMMKAMEYLRAKPDGYIKVEDDLASALSGLNGNNCVLDRNPPLFEDCSSSMSGISQIDSDGNRLPSETLAQIEQLISMAGCHMSESEAYKLLKAAGALHSLEDKVRSPLPSKENKIITVREQETALRKKIQDKANWLDNKFGWQFGEWNKRLHNKFRFKKRKNMTLSELEKCYDWMVEEAKDLAQKIKQIDIYKKVDFNE